MGAMTLPMPMAAYTYICLDGKNGSFAVHWPANVSNDTLPMAAYVIALNFPYVLSTRLDCVVMISCVEHETTDTRSL